MAATPTSSDGGVRVEVLDMANIPRFSEYRRFALLALGALGCVCASFSYAFNLFSGALQSQFSLSQRDLTNISTVGIVFAYFSLPYGTLYDYFGPVPVLVLASVLFPLGCVLMALTFNGVIEGTVVKLSVFNAIMNVGTACFDLANIQSMLTHFLISRGAVVAIMKTFLGLGSAIVGTIQVAYFADTPANYFFFLMSLGLVIGILEIIFMRMPDYFINGYESTRLSVEEVARREHMKAAYLTQKPPGIRFLIGIAVVVLLIVYLPTTSALIAYQNLGQSYKSGFAITAIIITMLYLIMALPVPYLNKRWSEIRGKPKKEEEAVVRTEEPIEGEEGAGGAELVRQEVLTEVDFIAPQYQTTFLQNLRTPFLWGIFLSFFATVGAEFVVILNARFLLAALSNGPVTSSLATLLTVLNGVGSAAGRLLMSFIEIKTQKRPAEERIPITISLYYPTVSIMIAIVLFLVLPASALPLAYVIAAVGNGFCAAVTVLVMRTIYAKDPAKHYNYCFLATMLSSILLNRFLYGEWYTYQAEKQGSQVCYGKECVMMPLLVMLGLNVVALLANTYCHLVYRRYSMKVLAERRRLREEAAGTVAVEEALVVDEGLERLAAPMKLHSNDSVFSDSKESEGGRNGARGGDSA